MTRYQTAGDHLTLSRRLLRFERKRVGLLRPVEPTTHCRRYLTRYLALNRETNIVLWLIGLILGSSIILMRYCPDTPMAIALRRYLAVGPVRWLMERKRSDVFYFVIVAGLFAGGGEALAVVGPEAVLLYAADLAFYLDLVMVTSLMAAASRLKLTCGAVRRYASSIRQRASRALHRNGRETTTRRKRERVTSDNDDEDSWQGLRLAA